MSNLIIPTGSRPGLEARFKVFADMVNSFIAAVNAAPEAGPNQEPTPAQTFIDIADGISNAMGQVLEAWPGLKVNRIRPQQAKPVAAPSDLQKADDDAIRWEVSTLLGKLGALAYEARNPRTLPAMPDPFVDFSTIQLQNMHADLSRLASLSSGFSAGGDRTRRDRARDAAFAAENFAIRHRRDEVAAELQRRAPATTPAARGSARFDLANIHGDT